MYDKIFYQFIIGFYSNGDQKLMAFTSPVVNLPIVLSQFFTISELKWYKSEVIKARSKQEKTYAGQNTYICYINGDNAEIGYYSFEDEKEVLHPVLTQHILDFIDEAITFLEQYESGSIPGIIPESKKDEWVIVPKEYVKDEWWEEKQEGHKEDGA